MAATPFHKPAVSVAARCRGSLGTGPGAHRGLRCWEQHRPVLEHHGMQQACAQGAEGLHSFRDVLSELGALGLASKEG